MSNTITITQNGTKDNKTSNLSEQTSLDTTVYLHATEDEEKDVRGSVLHKEEKYETGGCETDVKIVVAKGCSYADIAKDRAYIVCYDVGRQWQGQYPQGQPPYGQQGQGQYPQAQPPYGQQGQGQYPPAQPPYGQPPEYEEHTGLDYSAANPNRNAFVRKVTLLVFAALLFTAVFTIIVLAVRPLRRFFRAYCLYIVIGAMIPWIVLACAIHLSPCGRRYPTNYVCLVLVVILESLTCGAITANYKTYIVIWALVATVVLVFVCVCLALTKFDFTKYMIYVVAIGTVVSVLGIIMVVSKFAFGIYIKPLDIALTIVSTLVICASLIIELQMVLGGKTIELEETDYVLGAFMLYTSIMMMFFKMLRLLRLFNA